MVVDYGVIPSLSEKIRTQLRLGSLPNTRLSNQLVPTLEMSDEVGHVKSVESADTALAAVGFTNVDFNPTAGKAWEIMAVSVRVTAQGGGVAVSGVFLDFAGSGTDPVALATSPAAAGITLLHSTFGAMVRSGVYTRGEDLIKVLAITATANPTVKVGLLVREVDDPNGIYQGSNV